MPDFPLVSIIIPCYNCEQYISDCLDSVFKQTWSNLEVICVNDGSTDDTLEKLNKVSAPPSIQLVILSGENQGASHARNTGFANSKGEYIQLLDADDILLPNKIEQQLKAFDQDTQMVVSDYVKKDLDLKVVNEKVELSGITDDFLFCALTKVISSLNPLYRRNVYEKSGGYDENLSSAQDWDFNLRLALENTKVKYTHGVVAETRNVSSSVSSDFNKVATNCGLVLLKLEKDLIQYKDLQEHHKKVIGRLFYEAAVRTRNNSDSEIFYSKAQEWDPAFSFYTGSKKLLSSLIGKKNVYKIDHKRVNRA